MPHIEELAVEVTDDGVIQVKVAAVGEFAAAYVAKLIKDAEEAGLKIANKEEILGGTPSEFRAAGKDKIQTFVRSAFKLNLRFALMSAVEDAMNECPARN